MWCNQSTRPLCLQDNAMIMPSYKVWHYVVQSLIQLKKNCEAIPTTICLYLNLRPGLFPSSSNGPAAGFQLESFKTHFRSLQKAIMIYWRLLLVKLPSQWHQAFNGSWLVSYSEFFLLSSFRQKRWRKCAKTSISCLESQLGLSKFFLSFPWTHFWGVKFWWLLLSSIKSFRGLHRIEVAITLSSFHQTVLGSIHRSDCWWNSNLNLKIFHEWSILNRSLMESHL